jgi:CheY-like chemotaxis protein
MHDDRSYHPSPRPGVDLVPTLAPARFAPAVIERLDYAASTVLVIDANAISRQVLTTSLHAGGYHPLSAGSAREALALFAENEPDLVLQSLVLGDADSRQLAMQLRRLGRAPVVGYAGVLPAPTQPDPQRGFAGFLTKPFSPSHLVRSLPFYLWQKPRPAHGGALAPSEDIVDTIELKGTWRESGPQRATALIAEDNPYQRQRLQEAFSAPDFRVEMARHGIEALEKLGQTRPDVLVTDTLMTGCDGFELCLAVRRMTQWKGLPILLTPPAKVDPLDRRVAIALGADAYIARDRGLDQLVESARFAVNMNRSNFG